MYKKISIILIIVVVIALGMFLSKPSKAQYTSWVTNKLSQRLGQQNPMLEKGFLLFGGERLIEANTKSSDYGVVVVYETELRGQNVKVLGLFSTFIPIGKSGHLQ